MNFMFPRAISRRNEQKLHDTRMRSFALAIAFASTLTGCGAPARGPEYDRLLAAARRHHHDGRFNEAARAYEQAARVAWVPRDSEFARYESALADARAGNVAQAAAALRSIADATPAGAYSAHATLKLADLLAASSETESTELLERLVVRFSDSGSAQSALTRLLQRDRESRGPHAALDRLETLWPNVQRRAIAQHVAYQRAKLLEELGRQAEAREAYLAVVDRWFDDHGSLSDDALYRTAEIDIANKHFDSALALLTRLASQRESAWFIGSYDRPRYVQAEMRIAWLQEHVFKDLKAARHALERVEKNFPNASVLDDVVWRQAMLWRSEGNEARVCETLRKLTLLTPNSRYIPCIPHECANVPRPANSTAPLACHGYLLREQTSDTP